MGSPSRSKATPPGLTLAAALLGAAVLLGALAPPRLWAGIPTFCPILRLTGRPCPTCGLTRSWSALLHGDLSGALAWHALGPLLLAGLLGILGFWVIRQIPPRWPRSLAWGAALLWIAYTLLRALGILPWPGA